MNGQKRADIRKGMSVKVVKKEHQRTGELTVGVVKDLLTKSSTHPHGIKVRLESGVVGRVKVILSGTVQGNIKK
ncbi:YwbE family protein [Desulfocicer niacini]